MTRFAQRNDRSNKRAYSIHVDHLLLIPHSFDKLAEYKSQGYSHDEQNKILQYLPRVHLQRLCMSHLSSYSKSRSNALVPQGTRLATHVARAISAHSNQASLLYPGTNSLVDQTPNHLPPYRRICHFPMSAQ